MNEFFEKDFSTERYRSMLRREKKKDNFVKPSVDAEKKETYKYSYNQSGEHTYESILQIDQDQEITPELVMQKI